MPGTRACIRGWWLLLGFVALSVPATGQEFLPTPGEAGEEADAVGEATPEGRNLASDAIVDDFEDGRPRWRYEVTDAAVRLRSQSLVDTAAFDGDRSEQLNFVAGPGSHLYFSRALPKIPLTPDLRASIYVKSNRSGLQLMARVVLPADVDPDTQLPFVVTVAGTSYDDTDRWQRLDVANLVDAVNRQVWVLRAKTKRPIRMEGAYLERLAMNLYGGPGETEVFLDSMRLAPVASELVAEWNQMAGEKGATPENSSDLAAGDEAGEGSSPDTFTRIQILRNRLSLYDEPTRRHYPWVPTMIYAPGADVTALRRHGFDVYATRLDDDPVLAQEAVRSGFLLMPLLGRAPDDPVAEGDEAENGDIEVDVEERLQSISTYPMRESVAFWHLGEGLGRARTVSQRQAELEANRRTVSGLRDLNLSGVSPLTTASLAGDYDLYSRRPGKLDLMGTQTRFWGSATNPMDWIAFHQQRQDLTALNNPEGLMWTWIPTAAPAVYSASVWGQDAPPAWGRPQVQPEQIRLMTYAALSGGCRAIGFLGDSELTRETGQTRLIELALLNAEIDLFESVIAQGTGPIRLLNVYPPIDRSQLNQQSYTSTTRRRIDEVSALERVKAAAFDTPDRRGTLLLVADYEAGAQIQPGQLARPEVTITVPGHQSATAWEVTLGGVRYLPRKRVPGGIEVTLKSFGPTAMVLITADLALKDRLEQEVNQLRAISVDLAIQQADAQLLAISDTHARLVNDGHDVEDSASLLQEAENILRAARASRDRSDFDAAWDEARRAARPLRLLMLLHSIEAREALEEATVFAHDDPETKLLLHPVSAPPLTSFNTLPQFWLWADALRSYPFSENLLPGGEFEEADPEVFREEGWESVGYETEGLATVIETVEDEIEDPRDSERLLHLAVRPEVKDSTDRLPPFRDHPVVALRTPPIAVRKHQFLRISMRVKSPWWISPGVGGLIVRDSMGGSWLQYRHGKPMPEWHRLVLYRRAPEDGNLTVTVGFAATYGDIYIDDLRVERATRPYAEGGPMARRGGSPTNEPVTSATNAPPVPAENAPIPR